MNEELHTVNQELQTKLDEFTRTNNDIKNLLDSTDIATLFLDNSLCVRRFTSETSKVTHLIPGDVGGRSPISPRRCSTLNSLTTRARSCRRWSEWKDRFPPRRELVRGAHLPYRTLENVIDGLVITFVTSPFPRSWRRSCAPRKPSCATDCIRRSERIGR